LSPILEEILGNTREVKWGDIGSFSLASFVKMAVTSKGSNLCKKPETSAHPVSVHFWKHSASPCTLWMNSWTVA